MRKYEEVDGEGVAVDLGRCSRSGLDMWLSIGEKMEKWAVDYSWLDN